MIFSSDIGFVIKGGRRRGQEDKVGCPGGVWGGGDVGGGFGDCNELKCEMS